MHSGEKGKDLYLHWLEKLMVLHAYTMIWKREAKGNNVTIIHKEDTINVLEAFQLPYKWWSPSKQLFQKDMYYGDQEINYQNKRKWRQSYRSLDS